MKLATTINYMNQEMEQIESLMHEIVNAEEQTISETSSYLLDAGGKRIRPIFVLLAAQFGAGKNDRILNVAVTLEMIHMASLVHDDVIDNADTRRGQATVNYKWDNSTAMYTGDYLFARTIELLNGPNEVALHQVLSNTIYQVCIGEISQIRDKYDLNQRKIEYFKRIRRKTALLISTSTQLGAIAAETSDQTVKHLKRYGYYIGMSYQIIDDILDFTSDEKTLGKPVGSDLRSGNLTLPTILALEEDETIKDKVSSFFENPDETEVNLTQLIEDIKHSKAIEASFQCSQSYLRKALKELEYLPDIRAKRSLQKIAAYLGKRKF
ncbi:polyprenyl synthetase family protein [Halalkalibacillus halophilus]|uniref:polyprenyl synthetase family protein n=1 Tax=Halalkalibacillus halophilus TaxID=392827 RepID=UPI0003F4C5C6|nr:polyprenyl synthetase family protein [Halalkalibacillus halophilus]